MPLKKFMDVETILIPRSSNSIVQEFPFLTFPLTPPSPPASGERKVVGFHLKSEVLTPTHSSPSEGGGRGGAGLSVNYFLQHLG